ncbi:ATP-binding protein [Roseofilum reptotaenium]|uniref:ATP-binding protein n=1 Tax=Roseofilum reptotaenium TaxID=1233427 RepID=UPI000A916CA8|nr:ATP-binding protein [Roseofilum reptotaenium]
MDDLILNVKDAHLRIDREGFIKLLEELLDNAFKFSEPGTEITVFGEIEGEFYHLAIRDRGRGMSAEQIANFGAYQQFDRKIYEQQGSGLGLSIVKELVNLYDGKFTIESSLNKGTTIHVLLPTLPQAEES